MRSLSIAGNGDLIAAGRFLLAGGSSINRIARWDGVAWHPYGLGFDGFPFDVVATPDGGVLAGGNFLRAGEHVSAYLARWDPTGAPWIAEQPEDQTIRVGETATIALVGGGPGPPAYQWLLGGVELADGPTPHGSIISGAATDTLTIFTAGVGDTGEYNCVLTNDCGTTMSRRVSLLVDCAVDMNGDGRVDTRDFLAFFAVWAAGGQLADWNYDGTIDSRDFLAYLNAWSAGC